MTSIATTSQPACSASDASSGPDASSASRRETEVEMVRIAVRMARPAYRRLDFAPSEAAERSATRREVRALRRAGFRVLRGTKPRVRASAFPAADSGYAGQRVRIVIESADASTASLVEAAVDDVRVTRG